MTTRNFGAPITRNEDARLLGGQALFVDDVELPGMLHAAFLRSNVAHARIRSIDVAAARARPGVVAVYTAADLGAYWAPGPLLVPPPPIAGITFNQRTQVPLAKDKVRHVGEPLAVVLAESRYIAEDALADIGVELDPLPAVVDLEKALDDTSARASTTTCAATSPPMCGRAAATTPPPAHAPTIWSPAASIYDHGASSPIETRGIVANWDAPRQSAHDLGYHPGAGLSPQRACRNAGLERAAGAGHRAFRRRRLRAEDHAVLSRRGGASRGWR